MRLRAITANIIKIYKLIITQVKSEGDALSKKKILRHALKDLLSPKSCTIKVGVWL